MLPRNTKFRVLHIVLAFLECLGYGGLLYGWSSLLFILKDEGLFSNLCKTCPFNTSDNGKVDVSNDVIYEFVGPHSDDVEQYTITTLSPLIEDVSNDNCDPQNEKLDLLFTVSGFFLCVSCVVLGQVNFKFGTRVTRLLAFFLFVSGTLSISFTTNDRPWLIFPGLCFMACGGVACLITNTQVSYLFPKYASSIVGLLIGGYDASSGILLMIKLGYENGISRHTSFMILGISHSLTLINTFFFLPKDFITKTEITTEKDLDEEANNVEYKRRLTGHQDIVADVGILWPRPSLWSCILSPIYILHVAWISILQLRFYFLLGSLNRSLEKMFQDDKYQISHFVNVSMYMLMGGLVISPLVGILYDFNIRLFIKSRSVLRQNLMPVVIPMFITVTLCLLLSGLILLETPSMFYAIFVIMVLFRSFLYTIGTGFISAQFPSEYFGILYGIMIMSGGVILLLQYALFLWSNNSSLMLVNIFLLGLVVVTYCHPFYLWWTAHRAEQSTHEHESPDSEYSRGNEKIMNGKITC